LPNDTSARQTAATRTPNLADMLRRLLLKFTNSSAYHTLWPPVFPLGMRPALPKAGGPGC